jgi:hypothetical protein
MDVFQIPMWLFSFGGLRSLPMVKLREVIDGQVLHYFSPPCIRTGLGDFGENIIETSFGAIKSCFAHKKAVSSETAFLFI